MIYWRELILAFFCACLLVLLGYCLHMGFHVCNATPLTTAQPEPLFQSYKELNVMEIY